MGDQVIRNIILEGIDRVGKSTLARELARMIEADVHKMRVPRSLGQSMEFYGDHFAHLMNDERVNIWDRGHISELVYSTLYQPDRATSSWHHALRMTSRVIPDCCIVYLYPGNMELLEPDERPEANRYSEMNKYDRELSDVEDYWPVHRICTHHEADVSRFFPYKGTSWQWRTYMDLIVDVLERTGPLY